jgi:hypothetical protein
MHEEQSTTDEGSTSAYEGLESALIERNDSTFPAPASGVEPAVSGLAPRSIAGLFELLGE